MAWANPTFPNLPDFLLFTQYGMGIDPLYLPTDSPFYQWALSRAEGLVIKVPCASGTDYTLAVYNCAGHILVATAQDQTGRTFFADARVSYDLLKPSVGVVASTGDSSTSVSLAVPDAIKQLTIGDLMFMKTPWGREYLSYNQDFGGIWGLS